MFSRNQQKYANSSGIGREMIGRTSLLLRDMRETFSKLTESAWGFTNARPE